MHVYALCVEEGGGYTANRDLLGFLRKTLLIYIQLYQCLESDDLDLFLCDEEPRSRVILRLTIFLTLSILFV
ncbi:unnamed protein product [Arabidopsis halleri]